MPNYIVNQIVSVEVDESKFTPEFLTQFREHFFDLGTVEDHRQYLAELYATGKIGGRYHEFVEGYGRLGDMGILVNQVSLETEQE